jgi:hypothetical protein
MRSQWLLAHPEISSLLRPSLTKSLPEIPLLIELNPTHSLMPSFLTSQISIIPLICIEVSPSLQIIRHNYVNMYLPDPAISSTLIYLTWPLFDEVRITENVSHSFLCSDVTFHLTAPAFSSVSSSRLLLS